MRVAVIGGGAIGSAVAFFLASDPAFRGEITVIERDPTYASASSALSASSIRQQFSTPVNIRLSRFGFGFLRDLGRHLGIAGEPPASAGLVEGGYLYLAPGDSAPILAEVNAIQRAEGADIALLPPPELARRFPWLATEGVSLGSLGLSGEGWFDGYGLLQALRRKARSLDVRYLKAEATGFGGSKAVRLGDGSEVPFDRLVVAAGAWSAPVAAWLGIDLPVRARRRTVFVADIRATLPACPLIIDTSGVWLRPEGKQFICGASPPENRDPDDLPLEPDFDQWETTVWPALAARIPAFEAAKMIRAWAGYYEYNTFDQNGVVGAYPDRPDVLFATGFSGHGLQHAPGVGRGVAELLVHGFYRGLDLGDLSPARLLAGRPLRERNVI